MYILILILPLTCFLILCCFSYFLKKKDLLKIILLFFSIAWLCCFLALFEVFIASSNCIINLGYFINLTFFSCPFILLYDELSVFMCFVVISISILVHYYSMEYMIEDPFVIRFISYLSLFTFFMLLLITSGTILQLFIGWEGVGLSSYLLINFWFTRIQATKSALKAIVMNRFGDIGLYLTLIIIILLYKNLDLSTLSLLFNYYFVFFDVIPVYNISDLITYELQRYSIFDENIFFNIDNFIDNLLYYLNPINQYKKQLEIIKIEHISLLLNEHPWPYNDIYLLLRQYPWLELDDLLLYKYPWLASDNELLSLNLFLSEININVFNIIRWVLSINEIPTSFYINDFINIENLDFGFFLTSKFYCFNDFYSKISDLCITIIYNNLYDITSNLQFCELIFFLFGSENNFDMVSILQNWSTINYNVNNLINNIVINKYIMNTIINNMVIEHTKLPSEILIILAFSILLAAVGKSAQIGLHTWLPDAMEGPTPVSALIHAATMVTAGVFILIRFFFVLENVPIIFIWISIIGAITVFFAGSVGSFQYDLKKVIAYSTCSQLGYMIFACGISDYNISIFHLINHAFFKALLFLGAGAIIHSIFDEQDMRKMGGLYKKLPLTYISITIASLALIGIPFLSGYYSKDLILENAFINLRIDIFICYLLCLMGILFTTIYSLKILYLVFYNGSNFSKINTNLYESKFKITFVLILLSILSLFIGFFFKEWIYFSYSISNIWIVDNFISGEFLNLIIKLLPFSIILFSIIFYNIFWFKWKLPILIYHFFNQKWYFDLIYNNFFAWACINFSYFISFKLIDRAILEQFGSFNIANLNKNILRLQNIATGFIYHYIFILWNFCIWIFFFFTLIVYSLDCFLFAVYFYIIFILEEDKNMYEWPGDRHLYIYETNYLI